VKYLNICTPAQLSGFEIGIKTETEAVEFLRKINAEEQPLQDGDVKKEKGPLSRTQKKVLRQEEMRFKTLLEV